MQDSTPCHILSHTSHKLQFCHNFCDVEVFDLLKTAYYKQVKWTYQEDANIVGKQYFTSLYSCLWQQMLISQNIKFSWSKTHLYPFYSDRVLSNIQKSSAELYILTVNEMKMECCSEDKILQMSITSETLILLQKLNWRWYSVAR